MTGMPTVAIIASSAISGVSVDAMDILGGRVTMDLVRLKPLIDQSAASVSRAYPQVTFIDVAAVLWLWAVDNQDRVSEYLKRQAGEAERILRSILIQEGRKYAINERAAMTGYSPEDLTWYTPAAIRRVLPDVFDYEDWQSFQSGSSDGRGSRPLANATGDLLATILDVKGALSKIYPEQAAILKAHYGNGVSVDACAIALGIEPEAARKRMDRAVYALRDKLGGPRPSDPYEAVNGRFDTTTKGRRAISNAQSRAITDSNWG